MKRWEKILAALIITAGVVVAAFITSRHESQPTHIFTGVVRALGGGSVANARISAFLDGTSQTLYSDSDGIFHLVEPPDSVSLKLTVDAAGYDELTKDTNPLRTGPEEIFLHPHKTEQAFPYDPQIKTDGNNNKVVVGNGNKIK